MRLFQPTSFRQHTSDPLTLGRVWQAAAESMAIDLHQADSVVEMDDLCCYALRGVDPTDFALTALGVGGRWKAAPQT